MEIQDRNTLLQIIAGAKEGKPQFSFEGSSFVDVLNSTDADISNSPKGEKDVEFGQSIKQSFSLDVKEKTDKSFVDNKKEVSKKKEKETVGASKNKVKKSENEVKEENAVASVQASENKNSEVAQKEKTETVINETSEEKQEVSEVTAETLVGNEASDDGVNTLMAQEMLLSDMLVQGFEEGVLQNGLSSSFVAGSVLSDEVDEIVLSEHVKQDVIDTSKTMAEEFVPVSEEDILLAKQAKYFDDNVVTDKKMKIEVSVTEEKIAESLVKDVLKNRFEIDSIFQTVEDVSETQLMDAEVVLDEAVQNATDDTQTLTELKNSLYNEVKLTQETINNGASAKDISVATVSGKEVVAEVTNVSRNEAFAKINEVSSRDNYKGIGKEVVEQIKINITKSAVKGVDTIDIQLKPEDLGKIQIKMHITKDGKIQAEVVASRAETADMLQKDVSALSKAFNDAGYDTDTKSFTFSFQNENQSKSQEKDDAGLLKFIGDTLEQEAENVAGNDNYGYDPLLGLNIRV